MYGLGDRGGGGEGVDKLESGDIGDRRGSDEFDAAYVGDWDRGCWERRWLRSERTKRRGTLKSK